MKNIQIFCNEGAGGRMRKIAKRHIRHFLAILIMVLCTCCAACGKKSEDKSDKGGTDKIDKEVTEQSSGTSGSESESEPEPEIDAESGSETTPVNEPEPEPEPVVLDATYTTRYETANMVTFETFAFDYPSSWQITSEEVDAAHERVALSDGNGAEVCFSYYLNPAGGLGSTPWQAKVEKTADSQFVASMVQATDLTGLNPFMVAGITQDGMEAPTIYAVLPEEQTNTTEFLGLPEVALRFDYAGWMSFIATGGMEGFDEQQVREVLGILSSFRTI